MKNSIKLSALFLLLSFGAFAAKPVKAKEDPAKSKDVITLSAMKENRGVYVNVLKAGSRKPYVLVYDRDSNMLLKDVLPNKPEVTKGYVLTNLDNGNYTIMVISNNEVVRKQVHVYEEYNQKTFFFIN
ncbi:hypothetical protein [Mucilaginibacter pocheonensis]|uniref:Por secretion system C-terminal sorting domain-containing protein n=1 Tax=Mucilaginibacter pocheonensis TaxID=398050 RepID=A0ABU1TK52_9SPHI|nr:hypothetical protein [Mucilaginibacter pocheonensis]MDR6945196.1 hypothetical protein [Mucilaginibacter pocheonensis]